MEQMLWDLFPVLRVVEFESVLDHSVPANPYIVKLSHWDRVSILVVVSGSPPRVHEIALARRQNELRGRNEQRCVTRRRGHGEF